MAQLLEVRHLSVLPSQPDGAGSIIHDVSFTLRPGEILGLLGESGSGKTVLSRALTRLFSDHEKLQAEGEVEFEGQPIQTLDEKALMSLRKGKIRYVFQEPLAALNPLARIRTQMANSTGGEKAAQDQLAAALTTVGITDPSEVLRSYPHQLSTGMAQRVMIAMAILPSPTLLVADEPTSSVDVSLRRHLLELLASIQRKRMMSMILITHDLQVARQYADRILLMYKGRVVESCPRDEFFSRPLHPYAEVLIRTLDTDHRWLSPGPSAGVASDRPDRQATACRFVPLCPKVQENCMITEPPLETVSATHEVRCYYWK